MEIGRDILAVYGRTGAFARALPHIFAIPIAIELLRLGIMRSVVVSPGWHWSFTALATVGIACVMVPAFRWWRFGTDRGRLWRLSWRVLLGVVAMLAIQLTDQKLFMMAGHLAADIAGSGRPFFVMSAQLLWLFVSVPLFPWYVAMMSDDPLTLRQSFAAIRPRWFRGFAVVLGSLVPLLLLGGLLRGLLNNPLNGWAGDTAFWLAAAINGLLIAAVTLVTDATYFAVYRMARPAD